MQIFNHDLELADERPPLFRADVSQHLVCLLIDGQRLPSPIRWGCFSFHYQHSLVNMSRLYAVTDSYTNV